MPTPSFPAPNFLALLSFLEPSFFLLLLVFNVFNLLFFLLISWLDGEKLVDYKDVFKALAWLDVIIFLVWGICKAFL